MILDRGEPVELPPALVIQGTGDVILPDDMADNFAAAYRKAGGSIDLRKFEGQPHTFITKEPAAPASLEAIEVIKAFVRERMAAVCAALEERSALTASSPRRAMRWTCSSSSPRRRRPCSTWVRRRTGATSRAASRATSRATPTTPPTRGYNIRVQRLIDARKVDTSVNIFGETWGSPIFFCPVSSLGAFDPEAGVAVARVAGKRKHQMMLSTVDNASIVDVNKAHGSPAWFMFYPTDDWNVTQALVQRAESGGLSGDRPHGRPAGRPQHRDPVPRASPG